MVAKIKASTNEWQPFEVEENPLFGKSIEELTAYTHGADLNDDFSLPIFDGKHPIESLPDSYDPRNGPNGKCIHPIRS